MISILQTLSKSCANNLLRANLETGPWLDELENVLHASLGQVLVAPGSSPEAIGPEQAHIASLRTKDGGLAFGGLKHTTPFAFIGSWFLCLKEVASTLGIYSWATFTNKCPSVATTLQLASGMAVERGACNGTPVNWLHPMEHAIPKMQSLLAKQAAKRQWDEVLELLMRECASAMLGAGMNARAISLLEELRKRYPKDLRILAQLITAYATVDPVAAQKVGWVVHMFFCSLYCIFF